MKYNTNKKLFFFLHKRYRDCGILEWNPVPFPIPSRTRIPSRYRYLRDTGWGLDICELIIENVEEKNPTKAGGITPLHYLALRGHFGLCLLIINSVSDKNPANEDGITPLHNAARAGHLEICKLILQNVDMKNPPDSTGETLFDLAKENGFEAICDLIYNECDVVFQWVITWKRMHALKFGMNVICYTSFDWLCLKLEVLTRYQIHLLF